MPTLIVTNRKGGVGKTTTAVMLATIWAEQGSHLVDLDPEGHASRWHAAAAQADDPLPFGVTHPQQTPAAVAAAVRAARDAARWVVIDTEPRASTSTSAAADTADLVVIPTGASWADLPGALGVASWAAEQGIPSVVVLARAPQGTVDTAEMIAALGRHGLRTLSATVPERAAVRRAAGERPGRAALAPWVPVAAELARIVNRKRKGNHG